MAPFKLEDAVKVSYFERSEEKQIAKRKDAAITVHEIVELFRLSQKKARETISRNKLKRSN